MKNIKEELKQNASWENILITRQEVEPPIMRETGVIGIHNIRKDGGKSG